MVLPYFNSFLPLIITIYINHHTPFRLVKKYITTSTAGKNVNNQNSHMLLVRMKNDIATLENILAVSYNVKHTLTYELAITLLSIYQSELKTCLHNNLFVGSYSSFTDNCQKLENNDTG